MVVTCVTRQTIFHGEEALEIWHGTRWYVVHVNRRQDRMMVRAGAYETYTAAHDRLQQEVRQRR